METMQPVKEFFTVSVDVVGGVTFVSGTTLGKKFLLENLSRMAKTNIFSAFLAFCREKMIDTKIAAMKESLSNSKSCTDSKSPKARKVLFQAQTVCGSKPKIPEIKLRDTPDVKPEVDSDMDTSGCENVAGNGEIKAGQMDHSRNETETSNSDVNNQHKDNKNSNTMDTLESPSTESINSIVIKQEPDWDNQEEGVRTNDKGMHDSLQENEENNKDVSNHSNEEGSDENNEMTTERKDRGEMSQAGVYTVGNNMYLLPRPGSMISLNRKESNVLKTKKTTEALQTERHRNLRELDGDIGEDNSASKKIPNYQLQFRHPKTGKFCTYKQLKRIEKLKKFWKKKETQVQENEKDLDSSDGVKKENQDHDEEENRNRVQTVYYVHKVCTEWNCHCGKTFSSLPEFAEHDKEYHNTKLKLCEYCGEFMKRAKYKYHVKSHLPVIKNYQCSLCEKKYVNRRCLKKHKEFIHDGRRLVCDDCGKKFSGWASLYRHQLTHQNILNHLCTFCGKKFVTNYGMMSHIRVHTGEKPFSCEYCGLKFNHNVSRRNHIKKAHPGCEIHDSGRSSSHKNSDAV